ncbi:DUF4348 domain-containing protein [Pseudoduganella violaceinigra]|uniref:DUF4348 domain-containing protein n=1 Tax=Pseudoduganella violaceinigra TaxID=246602 RepID=UPI000406D572|nr:DUF4348 domain-containing protein [Pseudoduganella violaceinigra]
MNRYEKIAAPAVAAVLAGCSTPPMPQGCGQEQFDAFLPRYMSDRPFAVERTVFPLESIDKAEGKTSLVSREQFAASRLLADVIKADQLSTRQSATPGAMELNVFKPDADSHLYFYRFRQQNGCWYLWQFEDSSL